MSSVINVLTALAVVSVASTVVQAAPIDLSKDLPKVPAYSLFDSSSDAALKTMPSLSQLKYFEVRKKTDDCNKIAPKVFSKQKDLRGWIALSWLRCNGSRPANAAVERIEKTPELFESGPWKQSLWTLWFDKSMGLLESQLKVKGNAAENHIQALLRFSDKLSKEEKALLFRYLGELAQQKKEFAKALFYFQESLDFKETAAAEDKVRFLKKALNISSIEKEAGIKGEGKSLLPEQQIEDRMTLALRGGESVAAIKDSIQILNNFPGSRVARRLKDKPLEIYTSLLERGALNESEVASRAQTAILQADAARLADWAQTQHRRADYKGALAMANQALEQLGSSTQSTALLLVAGRSAQFLGQYEQAIRHFTELTLKHRGSDEASEALFRMGLIHYRLMNDSMAVTMFDKVVEEKKERYELSARYWLFRSLQREKNDRADVIRKQIVEEFPFSYYGIRLRAEQNANKVTWPSPVGKDSSTPTMADISKENSLMWLEATQNETWKRLTELLKNGWIVEAQVEMQDIPKPQSIAGQVLLGKKLSEAGISSLAIRWINEAMDQNTDLRKKEFLSLTFPLSYKELYAKEGARNDVSEHLLMSLTRQESAFNPRALSTSNAMGLMQMIPPTAREVAQKLGYKKIEIPEDMFRPEINIAMGSFYVADMLKQFSSAVPFALAAYNAGPTRMNIWISSREEVQKLLKTQTSTPEDEVWFDELPWTETTFYVKSILRNTLLYRLIRDGEYDLSPVVWSDLVNKKAIAQ